jgi:hypothetical protein
MFKKKSYDFFIQTIHEHAKHFQMNKREAAYARGLPYQVQLIVVDWWVYSHKTPLCEPQHKASLHHFRSPSTRSNVVTETGRTNKTRAHGLQHGDRPRRPHVGGPGGNPSLRRAAFTPRLSPASPSPEHAAGKAAHRWDGDGGRSSQVVWWRREPADRRRIASTAAAWGSAMVKVRDRGGVG